MKNQRNEKQEKLFEATNGGLDIILKYYPQIDGAKNKKFKIREDDKTPSAAIKRLSDGNYVVTDFGGDQTPRNALQIAMMEDGLSYREALYKWCGEYRIGDIQQAVNKAELKIIPAGEDDKLYDYSFDRKETMTTAELELMGPKVTQEHCEALGICSLKSFTTIGAASDKMAKKGYTKGQLLSYTTFSNDNYPIFLIENKDEKGISFYKVYQPLSWDKSYKFRYFGNKPKDFIYGYQKLKEAFDKKLAQDSQKHQDEGSTKPFKPGKLDAAIIVTGERDALNVQAFGYFPVWFNSETATISDKQMKSITKLAEYTYYLPDLDTTGEREANKRGIEHFRNGLRIIQLPESLKKFKDNRGHNRKDFRDYVEIYPAAYDFKKLLDVAMPMCFYDTKFTKDGAKYDYNPEHAAQFLQASGYCTLENENLKEGVELVHINKNNVVTSVTPIHIKKYMRDFCVKNFLPVGVRNMLRTSTKLNESGLMDLKQRVIDFSIADRYSQYLFFKNKTVKITGQKIELFSPDSVEKYVLEKEVIPHNLKLKADPFVITKDPKTGKYDVEVKDTSSKFLGFLINSSRIHWKAELEDRLQGKSEEEQVAYRAEHKFDIAGPLLNEEEQREQKQHLLNKFFALGYMIHRFKDPIKTWCIWAMDNKVGEEGDSNGRSGKSFFWKAVRLFMTSVSLPGRNPKLTDNPHVYDRVTEHTGYILVDDAVENLNFNFFFDSITGEFIVNPKNNASYEIPYEKSPKIAITSNFVLKHQDRSTIARLLYTIFSDYYHERSGEDDEEYRETRKISDDFGGKSLLKDNYPEEDWNADYNVFLHILRFYLSVPGSQKINPPMNNVSVRQQLSMMGDAFKMWADTYFALDGINVDTMVERTLALNDFIKATNSNKWSTRKFTLAVKAFCKLNDYTFNPVEFQNSSKRITRKNDAGMATDMIYIQTKPLVKEDADTDVASLAKAKSDKEDDLPF